MGAAFHIKVVFARVLFPVHLVNTELHQTMCLLHVRASISWVYDPLSSGPCHTRRVVNSKSVDHEIVTFSPEKYLGSSPNAVSAVAIGETKDSDCVVTVSVRNVSNENAEQSNPIARIIARHYGI